MSLAIPSTGVLGVSGLVGGSLIAAALARPLARWLPRRHRVAEWLPGRRKASLWAALAVYGLLSGCGLIPECVCTEIRKPPPPVETPVPSDAPPTSTTPPPAAVPSLQPAPLPPSVTQAPLGAPTLPTAVAPPPPAPSPAPAPITQAPRYGAQLGAFRTLANANGAWDRFKARYIDLLNTVPGPLLREVDLGPKGKFVRVMAGPFTTDQEARSLCLEVQARGGFCYVQPLGR